MPVKSWINYPGDEHDQLKAGRVQITGVAFGGMSAADEVEVSIDGGKNWEEASFIGPDLGPYAWRQFVLSVDLEAGEYEFSQSRQLMKRRYPARGTRFQTNRGYLNNSWRDHMLKVTVAYAAFAAQ